MGEAERSLCDSKPPQTTALMSLWVRLKGRFATVSPLQLLTVYFLPEDSRRRHCNHRVSHRLDQGGVSGVRGGTAHTIEQAQTSTLVREAAMPALVSLVRRLQRAPTVCKGHLKNLGCVAPHRMD